MAGKSAKSRKSLTKKAPRKSRKHRSEQMFLTTSEGDLAPPRNKKIDAAADAYVRDRDERMECTQVELTSHAALLEAMHEAELTEYSYDGRVVKVKKGGEKVKVKSLAAESADVDDEGNEGDED